MFVFCYNSNAPLFKCFLKAKTHSRLRLLPPAEMTVRESVVFEVQLWKAIICYNEAALIKAVQITVYFDFNYSSNKYYKLL